MISEILGIANTLLGMLNSNESHDQYGQQLEALKKQQQVSASAQRAANIYGALASQGLPGYESMREDVQNQLPTTLGEAQDFLTSGSAVDFIARSKAETDKQLWGLNMANAQSKQDNMGRYAAFLGGPMAQYEQMALGNQTDIGLMEAQNMMNKNSLQNDYMTSLTKAAGSGLDANWAKIAALLSKSGKNNNGGIDFNSQFTDYGMGNPGLTSQTAY